MGYGTYFKQRDKRPKILAIDSDRKQISWVVIEDDELVDWGEIPIKHPRHLKRETTKIQFAVETERLCKLKKPDMIIVYVESHCSEYNNLVLNAAKEYSDKVKIRHHRKNSDVNDREHITQEEHAETGISPNVFRATKLVWFNRKPWFNNGKRKYGEESAGHSAEFCRNKMLKARRTPEQCREDEKKKANPPGDIL